MSDELLNLSGDLLKNEELDVEGHVKSEGAEKAPDEDKGDNEVEAHLLHENLLNENLLGL
jgi:hypothetical protein